MNWLFVIFFIFLLSAVYGAVSAAPWLPTKKREEKVLVEKISKIKPKIVYDLGCGDGRLLFSGAQKLPETQFIGYEIFLLPYFIALTRKILKPKKYKNVKIIWGDFFRADISKADVIITFLLDKSYQKLKDKFSQELKDEALIVIEAWPIKGVAPIDEWSVEGGLKFNIYKAEQMKK